MKKSTNIKKGSAVALCLVFATVLLMMGLSFSKMTSTSKKQTVQIDERIKLEYLAHGITELALLKFQLYPADFYACLEAKRLDKKTSYLTDFTTDASEFRFTGKNAENKSVSSFNTTALNLELASMTILTNNKWNNEVLYIEAVANYTDQYNKNIDKVVTRLVDLDRRSLIPGR
jgi:hypothetical protein